MVDDPMDLEGGFDAILEIVVRSYTTPKNRLVMWGLPPFINTLSGHLLSNVGLFNKGKQIHSIMQMVTWTT